MFSSFKTRRIGDYNICKNNACLDFVTGFGMYFHLYVQYKGYKIFCLYK